MKCLTTWDSLLRSRDCGGHLKRTESTETVILVVVPSKKIFYFRLSYSIEKKENYILTELRFVIVSVKRVYVPTVTLFNLNPTSIEIYTCEGR